MMTNEEKKRPEAFTHESLVELLDKKMVFREGANSKKPSRRNAGITRLAQNLNQIHREAFNWTCIWNEDRSRNNKLATAIDDLIVNIRLIEPNYAYAANQENRSSLRDFPGYQASAARNLEALNRLYHAAVEVKKLGLPIWHGPDGQPVERWPHFAKDVEEMFHTCLPGRGKEAGYRFIVAITPEITNENPTYHAVKTHLKRNRPANRGRPRR
jgi:hypothetical protein